MQEQQQWNKNGKGVWNRLDFYEIFGRPLFLASKFNDWFQILYTHSKWQASFQKQKVHFCSEINCKKDDINFVYSVKVCSWLETSKLLMRSQDIWYPTFAKHVLKRFQDKQKLCEKGLLVRRPGIEPGSQEWESCMIPLHQRRLVEVRGEKQERLHSVCSPCIAFYQRGASVVYTHMMRRCTLVLSTRRCFLFRTHKYYIART